MRHTLQEAVGFAKTVNERSLARSRLDHLDFEQSAFFSMRSHTIIRPFHCVTYNFGFKTKGNLTKHLKSKNHLNKWQPRSRQKSFFFIKKLSLSFVFCFSSTAAGTSVASGGIMSEGGEARLTLANVDVETTLIKRSENECRFVNNDLYASDADEEGEDGDDEWPPTDALAYRRFGQGEQPTSILFCIPRARLQHVDICFAELCLWERLTRTPPTLWTLVEDVHKAKASDEDRAPPCPIVLTSAVAPLRCHSAPPSALCSPLVPSILAPSSSSMKRRIRRAFAIAAADSPPSPSSPSTAIRLLVVVVVVGGGDEYESRCAARRRRQSTFTIGFRLFSAPLQNVVGANARTRR